MARREEVGGFTLWHRSRTLVCRAEVCERGFCVKR